MSKNCGIYKITSPTGRTYIGQSIKIDKRFKGYKTLKTSANSQVKLYRSFIKHGVENHTFEIIEECKIEDLNCRERYWQDFYDVLNGGLNCKLTKSVDKSGKLSDETKEKISKANSGENHPMYGKKASKRSIELRVEKISGENHPMYGKKVSKERREKTSETCKKRLINVGGKNGNSKLVICLETGIFYDSLRDASEALNIKMSFLKRVLNKNNKCINRTSLLYVEDYNTEIIKNYRLPKDNRQYIKVLDTDTNVIYNSIKEVSDIFNINYSTLYSKLKGDRKNNTNFKIIKNEKV